MFFCYSTLDSHLCSLAGLTMIDPGLETKNSTPLTNGGRSDSGQGIDIDIDTVSSSDSNDNAGLMAQLEAMQSKGSKRLYEQLEDQAQSCARTFKAFVKAGQIFWQLQPVM